MMTKRQQETLRFINGYLVERGYPPTFQEIRDAIGAKSQSSVVRIVNGLEERGVLTRRRHGFRTILLQEKANTFGFFDPTPSQTSELIAAQQRYGTFRPKAVQHA